MPGIPIKWIVIGLAFVAVVTTVYLGYNHYNNLVQENVTLRENAVKLHTTVEQQKQTIALAKANAEAWKSSFDNYQTTLESLIIVNQRASQELTRLNRIFAKHDIERLAQAKPRLIERRINRGTVNALSMFERATSGNQKQAFGIKGSAEQTANPKSDTGQAEAGKVESNN